MSDQERNQQEAELEIEQKVQEIGRLIESSPLERREELRQMVSSLMEQEVLRETRTIQQAEREWIRRPLNPVALGLLFLILGAGLFFLLPPVGLIVAFGGVLGIIWGVFSALMSGTAKGEHAESEEAQSGERMAHSAAEEERQKA